jgi:hypothetical protein
MKILTNGYIFSAEDDKQTFYYGGAENIFALLPNGHAAPDMEAGWEVFILQGNNTGKVKIECQSGINFKPCGGDDNNFTKGRAAKVNIQLVEIGSLYIMNGNNGPK